MTAEELYEKEFGDADSVPKESVIRLLKNFTRDNSRFNLNELRHIAVNFAITCEKGYGGDFDSWFNSTSDEWRKIANKK